MLTPFEYAIAIWLSVQLPLGMMCGMFLSMSNQPTGRRRPAHLSLVYDSVSEPEERQSGAPDGNRALPASAADVPTEAPRLSLIKGGRR